MELVTRQRNARLTTTEAPNKSTAAGFGVAEDMSPASMLNGAQHVRSTTDTAQRTCVQGSSASAAVILYRLLRGRPGGASRPPKPNIGHLCCGLPLVKQATTVVCNALTRCPSGMRVAVSCGRHFHHRPARGISHAGSKGNTFMHSRRAKAAPGPEET